MAGEKSKTPADVLARQRAERRIYAALDGLSSEDASTVLGAAYGCFRRRVEDEIQKRYASGYAGGPHGILTANGYVPLTEPASPGSAPCGGLPTPAGTEQQ